jgi:hypothetical protein
LSVASIANGHCGEPILAFPQVGDTIWETNEFGDETGDAPIEIISGQINFIDTHGIQQHTLPAPETDPLQTISFGRKFLDVDIYIKPSPPT